MRSAVANIACFCCCYCREYGTTMVPSCKTSNNIPTLLNIYGEMTNRTTLGLWQRPRPRKKWVSTQATSERTRAWACRPAAHAMPGPDKRAFFQRTRVPLKGFPFILHDTKCVHSAAYCVTQRLKCYPIEGVSYNYHGLYYLNHGLYYLKSLPLTSFHTRPPGDGQPSRADLRSLPVDKQVSSL